MKRLIILAAVFAGLLVTGLSSQASAGWRGGYYYGGGGWNRGYYYGGYAYPGYYSRYPRSGYYYGRPRIVVQTPGFGYRYGPSYYGGYYGSPYYGGAYYW
ncbi:MAG: hypothetical protein HY290_15920 [Planctomycetia bacterium]|nr:hypothetical protein [Planctomycetia bacterium]